MPGEPWDPIERDRRYASCKRAGLARLISEGDSWFDYPPHPNIIDFLDGEGFWAIKRFEKSGDTLENIASDANLARIAGTARKEKPEAILLSAGGNDLFRREPQATDAGSRPVARRPLRPALELPAQPVGDGRSGERALSPPHPLEALAMLGLSADHHPDAL